MTHAYDPNSYAQQAGSNVSMPQANEGYWHYQEVRTYVPFRGLYDPCPPLPYKTYVVPINQYINFQPPGMQQFSPQQALMAGTLWPALYSSYQSQRGGRVT